MITLRNYLPSDFETLYALNESEVPHLGSETREDFQSLIMTCIKTRVAIDELGTIAGFIIIMDETTNYDSPNFLWFKARYTTFTYVDRVAVMSSFRGKNIGRMFYEDISASLIACEVNLDPPNINSMKFHTRLGFKPVGTQVLEGGKKTVSMLIKTAEKKT